ncbi:hypothetical protein SAMN05661086_02210 [Anaeromicropila populeti]|uniref:Uncharacterized protein n=1 Tax=Anaeromicropila populeti TaxID=37658 RepID=A0A1I6K5J0_9FIRM|nr:hypothetical protein SAMN05661086_02210 [Anaeromicropila populeti]
MIELYVNGGKPVKMSDVPYCVIFVTEDIYDKIGLFEKGMTDLWKLSQRKPEDTTCWTICTIPYTEKIRNYPYVLLYTDWGGECIANWYICANGFYKE